MYLYVFTFLGLFCYDRAVCQNDYKIYLTKTNQVTIKNNYDSDSVTLSKGFKIKFSRNDTSVFANLLTKDTIFSILESDISSGLKMLGGLCADFDSSFFWGISMGNNIYGRVYHKANILISSEVYVFISKYKFKDKNVILLADPNYDDNLRKLYIYSNKNCIFLEYRLSNRIASDNLKYLRIFKYRGSVIQLIDIKTSKLYSMSRTRRR